jgi:hypothetical protein
MLREEKETKIYNVFLGYKIHEAKCVIMFVYTLIYNYKIFMLSSCNFSLLLGGVKCQYKKQSRNQHSIHYEMVRKLKVSNVTM